MRNIRGNGGYGDGELNIATNNPIRESGVSYFPNFNATSNGNGSTIPNGNGSTIPNGTTLNNGVNNFGNGNGNGNGGKIVNGGNRLQIIQDCFKKYGITDKTNRTSPEGLKKSRCADLCVQLAGTNPLDTNAITTIKQQMKEIGCTRLEIQAKAWVFIVIGIILVLVWLLRGV